MPVDYCSNPKDKKKEEDCYKESVRHVHHKFCITTELHTNLFHEIDDDNILMPQFIKTIKLSSDNPCQNSQDLFSKIFPTNDESNWKDDFLKIVYADIDHNRINSNIQINSIGTIEYMKVFKNYTSNSHAPENINKISNDLHSLEQAILKNKNEFETNRQKQKQDEIENLKNKLMLIIGIFMIIIWLFFGEKNNITQIIKQPLAIFALLYLLTRLSIKIRNIVWLIPFSIAYLLNQKFNTNFCSDKLWYRSILDSSSLGLFYKNLLEFHRKDTNKNDNKEEKKEEDDSNKKINLIAVTITSLFVIIVINTVFFTANIIITQIPNWNFFEERSFLHKINDSSCKAIYGDKFCK